MKAKKKPEKGMNEGKIDETLEKLTVQDPEGRC